MKSPYIKHIVIILQENRTPDDLFQALADEGAPDAWLVLDPALRDACADLAEGDELVVITWLHEAGRDVQVVRPREDPTRPPTGVFSTRSQDRPNPIGLHPVTVLAIEGARMLVSELEALDGTPVIDVKPVR